MNKLVGVSGSNRAIICKKWLFQVISFGVLIALSTPSYALNEALGIRLNLANDVVKVPSVYWIESKSKIKKGDPRDRPGMNSPDRVFDVLLLDSRNKEMDSIKLILSAERAHSPDSPGMRGPVINDRSIAFPVNDDMHSIRVKKDEKTIFEEKIRTLIAESLQDTLERQDYFGSKSIKGVAKSFSVVRGNEKAFLEQLQKATQDCESIGGFSLNKCAGIAATAAKAIKRTLGK